MKKTYEELNEKIKKGEALVLTAEEVSKMSKELSPKEILKKVDIVTTGTFGAMCSSGMFINFGHSNPPIKMKDVYLNNVEAYAGIAAVDAYVGATEISENDPGYGGAHVIEALIAGEDVKLKAYSDGTDCYPLKEIYTKINKNTVNEMIMFNPRNSYQNYNVAVNGSNKIKYTYMGSLLPNFNNATYSSAGELSPLLNDPELRTIGIGTRIFLGGTQGFVSWNGTQFHTTKPLNEHGIPKSNAATIATIGNAKEMSREFVRAAYIEKYGVTIFIGVGIPIPVLDEDMARRVSIRNHQIETSIVDYGEHPSKVLGTTNYEILQSGRIELFGKSIQAASLSSLYKARIIADILKKWIKKGDFYLSQPVQAFPRNTSLNKLEIR
ncbi:MAG: homocysteine biosynthesis protein [Bacteroidales bacterium]|nr:homocysteine biosynthesis protein [Bacteroidales bacterium]